MLVSFPFKMPMRIHFKRRGKRWQDTMEIQYGLYTCSPLAIHIKQFIFGDPQGINPDQLLAATQLYDHLNSAAPDLRVGVCAQDKQTGKSPSWRVIRLKLFTPLLKHCKLTPRRQ